MQLPNRPYLHYCGIDPGFTGGIALINAAGTSVRVWPMPVTPARKQRQREIDLDGLRGVFRRFQRVPDTAVGIEWPTTRPGEGAERCERFGRQKGILHAFAYWSGLDYFLVAPNLWKPRLGLPGKDTSGAIAACVRLWEKLYPAKGSLVLGPRGGVLDGLLDALLIAHFLRVSGEGIDGAAKRYGRGSVEAQAAALSWGGRKRFRPLG